MVTFAFILSIAAYPQFPVAQATAAELSRVLRHALFLREFRATGTEEKLRTIPDFRASF